MSLITGTSFPLIVVIVAEKAAQAYLRLDDGQFELRPLKPRASPVGIATAVVVDSALRRRYPVSCALQVGNGLLPRLRLGAFLARSLRHPPGEDGRLELLLQLNIFGAAS